MSVNRPSAFRFGTVGRPLDNVRLRLTQENEIMVKGPNVMLGYVGNHDAGHGLMKTGYTRVISVVSTRMAISFSPGVKRYLKIHGRYVSSKIELALQQILKFNMRSSWVKADLFRLPSSLLRPIFRGTGLRSGARLETLIAKACRSFARHERIRRYHYVTEPLQLGSGLLTPTMKPRRELIAEHYAAEVEHIYSVSGQQIRPNIGELVARSRRKK